MDWLSDDKESEVRITKNPWKVLIVDDDYEIFQVTKLALSHFEFEGRTLDLVYAGSADKARQIFSNSNDIALAVVDVVMESDDAGLRLVEFIRESLGNHFTRIVLRTGQPGFAPESEIIRDYDIDGYKSKTELSQQALTHFFFTSLRSYRDLVRIQRFQLGLEALIESLRSMQTLENFSVLTSSLLLQMRSVLTAYDSAFVIKLKAVEGNFTSDNSVKRFAGADKSNADRYTATIQQCLDTKTDIQTNDFYAHYSSVGAYESALLLVGTESVNKYSRRLIAMFSANVCVLLERLSKE